jgi:hypothetical protein
LDRENYSFIVFSLIVWCGLGGVPTAVNKL